MLKVVVVVVPLLLHCHSHLVNDMIFFSLLLFPLHFSSNFAWFGFAPFAPILIIHKTLRRTTSANVGNETSNFVFVDLLVKK